MKRSYTGRKRFRKNFGKIRSIIDLPNLISLQNDSFESFLQYKTPPNEMKNVGLLKIFNSIFPISDSLKKSRLEFHGYEFDEPKYSESECKRRGGTYAAGLRAKFRLIIYDKDDNNGDCFVKSMKDQDVYLGDMPVMTDKGTFIFNGIERVIVSQMHRSPGVFFGHDLGRTHNSGKLLFSARIIPYRGSWIDFEFDYRDVLYVRFDRKRKVLASTFLMCLYNEETEKYLRELGDAEPDPALISGMSREDIIKTFYDVVEYKLVNNGWAVPFDDRLFKNKRLVFDLINAETGEVVAKAGDRLNARKITLLKNSGLKEILIGTDDIYGKRIACDVINEQTGEIYCEAGTKITEDLIDKISPQISGHIKIVVCDNVDVGDFMLNTLDVTQCPNRDEALCEFYKSLYSGDVPTPSMGEDLLNNIMWNEDRYNLSEVGRAKINDRLGLNIPENVKTLQKEDILAIIRILCLTKNGKREIDDIDNLGNRRIRSVGELIENQCRTGMLKLEKSIREKMSSVDVENYIPSDLLNAKALITSVKDFFVTSQLSQFMDQTNPLSEVTHKRRLSALGPGGLSRERAGFEVRDVHPTHYSRLCPIETPEGQNIGLITSLACYARINKFGFIEAPYRKIVDGKVTNEFRYMTATEEGNEVIAQADISTDSEGNIIDELLICRKSGEIGYHPKSEITYADISPQQIVSVGSALIPFLHCDDATRALMGANMQRQAVPLLRPEAPLVGTGMEMAVARDSGASTVAKRGGIVDLVDANRIVVRVKDPKSVADIYTLSKFQCSNMGTCINQKPLVSVGDVIEPGDIIADGPAVDNGELALGRNLLVAFMSWNGYSYEDSVTLSEKLVKEDALTSIHIESFEIMARDTKLGNEEITRDIPNIAEESLKNLDETGIVYVGAEVNPGDILVGKVTPKGETIMSPEEKLLRAIFNEKSSDVKDSSFRVPPGVSGTVVEVRVLTRKGVEKDERTLAVERQQVERLVKDREAEISISEKTYSRLLREKMAGHKAISGVNNIDNPELTEDLLKKMPFSQLREIKFAEKSLQEEIDTHLKQFDEKVKYLQSHFDEGIYKLKKGDDLPAGVLKIIKVFVAQKRKIQPGDKMAGRHGDKGVVARVLPVEDMPYLEDGTPVDIVLNPLSLPSRMNLGQILETHLGASAHELGVQIKMAMEEYRKNNTKLSDVRQKVCDIYENKDDIDDINKLSDKDFVTLADNLSNGVPMATPVFDGAKLDDIEHYLQKAGLDTSGQVTLYDGRTGEPFDRKVTVGYKYMLKLHHLVDDKIHARSVGPYSLITQQPLGGKAQFGGQRFGEMEVWALESYGAAYTLNEIVTVKSDDVDGRVRTYNNIIKDINTGTTYGSPESFHVLLKEVMALGLNMVLESSEKECEDCCDENSEGDNDYDKSDDTDLKQKSVMRKFGLLQE